MEKDQTKYPSSPHWVIEDATWLKEYKVKIWFRDGSIKIVDLEKKVMGNSGPVFVPLRDLNYFKTVSFDDELGTICWPNEADFAPEFLYDNGVEAIPLAEKLNQKKQA